MLVDRGPYWRFRTERGLGNWEECSVRVVILEGERDDPKFEWPVDFAPMI